MNLTVALGVDDHECRLTGHPEMTEDIAWVITDLRKGERVLVDESLERGVVACPSDPNEFDLVGPTFVGCFDRSSFSVAYLSSGCPEPEGHRFADQ